MIDSNARSVRNPDVTVLNLKWLLRDVAPKVLEVHEVLGDQEVRDGCRDLESSLRVQG